MKRAGTVVIVKGLWARLGTQEKMYSAFAVALMIIVGWINAQPAILLGGFVTDYIKEIYDTSIVSFCVFIGAIFALREILIWVRKRIAELSATRIERDEYIKATEHVLDIDMIEVGKQQSGALNYNVNVGIEGVVKLYKVLFLDLAPVIISSIVVLYIVLEKEPIIAAVFFVFFIITVFISILQMKTQAGIRVRLLESKSKIAATVVELLAGISYVRAIGGEYGEKILLRKRAENLRNTEMKHHTAMMTFDGVKQLIEGIGFIITILLSFKLANSGVGEIGDVLTFTILYGTFMQPVKEMHRFIDQGGEAIVRIGNLHKLYEIPTITNHSPKEKNDTSSRYNTLVVKNLSWSVEDKNIISNISYDFSGKKVGIIGYNGSGKSTLVKLILSNYHDYSGSVLVGDIESKDILPEERWKAFTFVPQHPFIKRGTLRDNLMYGMPKSRLDDNKLTNSLKDVHLYDRFFSEGESGLDSLINESGSNLSGGEKQRLVLARELLKENDIWILDEPTSALDPVNEKIFMDVVNTRSKGKTVIMIAHRLETLRNFDTIIEMKDGEILRELNYSDLAIASN